MNLACGYNAVFVEFYVRDHAVEVHSIQIETLACAAVFVHKDTHSPATDHRGVRS
jgi:hypothetical protein